MFEHIRIWFQRNVSHIIFIFVCHVDAGAEVSPKDAYEWTEGRCLYASRARRTDDPPVTLADGRTFDPSSVQTSYIFPGVGLGTVVSRSTRLRDEMFLAAAEALAAIVRPTFIHHYITIMIPAQQECSSKNGNILSNGTGMEGNTDNDDDNGTGAMHIIQGSNRDHDKNNKKIMYKYQPTD
jgi:hypothetical protein